MSAQPLLIVNYHQLSENHSDQDPFCLSTAQLVQHLSLIKENAITVVSLNQNEIIKGNGLRIALSFDDGYASHKKILPVLDQFGFSATFFPIIEFLDTPGRLKSNELKEFTKLGHIIGSHGCTHDSLAELSIEEAEEELRISKKFLEDKTGGPVSSFSLPYGDFNSDILKLGKHCGYDKIFTTGLKINFPTNENILFYRWNMRNDLSIDTLKEVLRSNGQLSLNMKFKSEVKQYTRHILGRRLSEQLKKIVG